MITGLWNGVTGLNTFERALTTQSNNVTNSNTIGHKKDQITFQDMMYQSRYGKGVDVQAVQKNFEQGSIKVTDNTLDAAIEGDGFFVVRDATTNSDYFTRAGNFKMGVEGYLESMEGYRVLGSPTTISGIVSSDATTQFNATYTNFIASEPINTTTFNQTINARSTDFTKSAVDSGISGQGFKTAAAKIADIQVLMTDYNNKLDLYSANPVMPGTSSVSQVTQIDFADFNTKIIEGGFIEVNINGSLVREYYDTDPQTTINQFADKISAVKGVTATVDANGLLTINTLTPGEDLAVSDPAIDSSGYGVTEITAPVTGTGLAMVNSSRDALKLALENADAKFLEMTNFIGAQDADLTGLGQMQLRLNDLNISENVFGQLSIEDGVIYAKDDNNKFLIGKLETANFSNPGSLEPQGSTLYAIGKETGDMKNASNVNKVIGGAIELSNTNFSDDLVDLMVYQRAFEASSKSITTSDEFLKTAIQLKK